MTVVYTNRWQICNSCDVTSFPLSLSLFLYDSLKLNCQLLVMQHAYRCHLPAFFFFFNVRRLICDCVPTPIYPIFDKSYPGELPTSGLSIVLYPALFPATTHSLYLPLFVQSRMESLKCFRAYRKTRIYILTETNKNFYFYITVFENLPILHEIN